MDYSQLSDFEINKRICDVFWPDFKKSSECNNKTFPQNTATVYMKNGYGGFSRDYCNNPADAWPIIESNRIGVMPSEMKTKELWMSTSGRGSYAYHENPLRAAMIVYLQMQDAKHA